MAVDLSMVPATVGPRFTRHDGSPAGADDDFIVLPDPAIGEVVSAGTNRSLRGYHKSQSLLTGRIVLAVLGGIFGAFLGFGITKAGIEFVLEQLELDVDRGLISLLAFAAMAVTGLVSALVGFFLPLAFRAPLVTYVGRHGLQRYVKPKLGAARTEILRFPDADELRVRRVRNHYNGAYTGTTYDYHWFKTGRSAFRIFGQYRDDRNDAMDPVNFAFAAEKAWTRYRLLQVQEQMRREGVVRFRAGSDFIGVGNGFIEIGWKGAVERLDRPAIQSLTLQQGTLVIKRQGAREGLFRSEGVFRFPVSSLADFRTFLVALEVATGFHFS